MPRNLPWLAASTTTTRPKRPASSTTPAQKRVRVEKSTTPAGTEDSSVSKKKGKSNGRERVRSSSPPPEPLPEVFMKEGLDQDDQYRMVEDEFHSIAQKFTVHLHAAEYKRQQRLAKTRHTDIINNISRPVTGKMPDQTKRKLEAVNRAKQQKSVLDTLLGKKDDEGEISDESDVELPYVGTTLHGLMDGPRGKPALLASFASKPSTSRAAAGCSRPSTATTSPGKSFIVSPRPKSGVKIEKRAASEESTADESDDVDLDAPMPPPKKLFKEEMKIKSEPGSSFSSKSTTGKSRSHASSSGSIFPKAAQIKTEPYTSSFKSSFSASSTGHHRPSETHTSSRTAPTTSSRAPHTRSDPSSIKSTSIFSSKTSRSKPDSQASRPQSSSRTSQHPTRDSRDSEVAKKSSPESSRVSLLDIDEFQPAQHRMSRLERARYRRAAEEKEQQKLQNKKKIDIIPSF